MLNSNIGNIMLGYEPNISKSMWVLTRVNKNDGIHNWGKEMNVPSRTSYIVDWGESLSPLL